MATSSYAHIMKGDQDTPGGHGSSFGQAVLICAGVSQADEVVDATLTDPISTCRLPP